MLKKTCPWSGICSVMVVLMLAGCAPDGSSGGWFRIPSGADAPDGDEIYDMKLQHAQTSPIPGASARVLPPPPGIVYSGAAVGACVTSAGYCALAAQTKPGQNCLCMAASGNYGGATGVPPNYNYKTNPW